MGESVELAPNSHRPTRLPDRFRPRLAARRTSPLRGQFAAALGDHARTQARPASEEAGQVGPGPFRTAQSRRAHRQEFC